MFSEAPPTARHSDFVRSVASGKNNARLQAIYDRALYEKKQEKKQRSPQKRKENRAADKADKLDRKERAEAEMPFAQARGMLQQRLQAIVMQDKHHLKNIWREFDQSGNNYLTAPEFHGALSALGIEISEQEAIHLIRKFCKMQDRIYYEEFIINFLALPSDFFSQKHTASEAQLNKNHEQKTQSQLQSLLPKGSSVEAIDRVFRTRIRKELFNTHRTLMNVLKRPSQKTQYLRMPELYSIFCSLNMMPTQAQLEEIFKYFDHNDDGKIHYEEFACELLRLPRPNELRGTTNKAADDGRISRQRPQLGSRTKELLNCLRLNCERSAVTSKMLVRLFKHFDKDGSGNVAYDELSEMVREYGCNVEGADAAAMLLEHYTGSSGGMSYIQFITKVLGLRPDALRGDNQDRMSTPELQQAVSSSFKNRMFHNPKAIKKAFREFDRDGSGKLSFKEFCDGCAKLQLPISTENLRKIFEDMDDDRSGWLTVEELAAQVLKVPGLCDVDESGAMHTMGYVEPPDSTQEMSLTTRSSSSLGDYSSGLASSRGGSTPGGTGRLHSKLLEAADDLRRKGQPVPGFMRGIAGIPEEPPRAHSSLGFQERSQGMGSPGKRSPFTAFSPISHRSDGIDDLIRSQPNTMRPPGTAHSMGSMASSRSGGMTRRSVPKTASERRALDRLSQHRHTFGSGSSPVVPRLPALGSPEHGDYSAFGVPKPVTQVHALDGRATMGLKPPRFASKPPAPGAGGF